MPDIRYVCLSDMHLGAETSLLTNLETANMKIAPAVPSPVLRNLVDCLWDLVSRNEDQTVKPTLILNGDILELALALDNDASMTFERFIDLVMPDGNPLFERIVYLPGNHDHHLWETARETQYVEFLTSNPGVGWGKPIPPPWHATNAFRFIKPLQSYFLTSLIRRRPDLKDRIIETAYPNFGVMNDAKTKAVIFHHGHFTEELYHLMSTLKTMLFPGRDEPKQVWDLEAENFAWIDFVWSTLGRSGAVGKGMSEVYEKIQDEKQAKRLLANLAKGLAERYDLPGWGDAMEAKFLEMAFNLLVDGFKGLERNRPETVLSEDAEKGLWKYMEVYLQNQIINEPETPFPDKVTFVFGHTHKPFEEDMNFSGFSDWVDVYNCGGWVVDTVNRQPLHGGAVVLVDENLDAVSLRMYNESLTGTVTSVLVAEARHPGDTPGPFFTRVDSLVKPDRLPWRAFSAAAARAVNVRAQNLRARINSPI